MDSIFIFGLMLVLFGPKKLPEIARQAGKLMMEFRRASNEFKMQMEDELRAAEQADRQKKIDAEIQAAHAASAGSLTDGTTAATATPEPASAAGQATTEPATTEPDTAPSILPPSVGETVSSEPPNRYRTDAAANPGIANPEVTNPEVAPVGPSDTESASAAGNSAEDFYAQREAELRATAETTSVSVAESVTQPAAQAASANGSAVTEKLPGTEMYPDTAPMAESEQAPIHHG
ncbi:MAG TPA: twin-arginine translocase TatA/TatE family subunit [Acidisarcina sp.]|nr:twin-arginine translocase TatA/TatE family subunit [Acidisarcina sp.]